MQRKKKFKISSFKLTEEEVGLIMEAASLTYQLSLQQHTAGRKPQAGESGHPLCPKHHVRNFPS